MATQVVDSDSHVIESERTWEFMADSEQSFKPRLVVPKDGSPGEYWLIEGRVFGRDGNVGRDTDADSREAADISKRLAHMDEIGVDIHVMYPSLFLRPLTHHADTEIALCRSYNRWLADVWKQGQGRLRWVVIPPLSSMDEAIAELHFGKENGACGVFMRGLEGDRRLSDPYLFPLYEEAISLDMPICIHAGNGNFPAFDVLDRDAGFSKFKLPGVGAFHDILMRRLPDRFPDLRWAFIEISASWVPYVMNDLMLRFRRQQRNWAGADLLRESNIYVACQTEDDLPYVLSCAGDENIVIGTDYGHNDTSTEILALRNLREGGKVSTDSAEKILSHNPTRLYAL